MPRCSRAAVLALTAAAFSLSGCSGDATFDASPDPTASAMGHIHGVGVDPADGTLYAATHFGLFRIEEGEATRVADRWQDTMSFTIVGDRHFLGSGHPDLQEDLPVHLGLIESTDAGETWEPLALEGEADFHALEPAGDDLYAVDALTGSLMVTQDRRTFRTVTRLTAVDLAVDPASPNRVLATSPSGRVVSVDPTTGKKSPVEAPPTAFLDWPRPDLLVGLGPAGAVHISTDGGDTWRAATSVPGDAAALEITPTRWYVASSEGLFSSDDGGTRWTPIRARQP